MTDNKTEEKQASYQPIKKLSLTNITATVFGLGYIKYAPGTFGSVVGLIDFATTVYFFKTLNFYYIPFVIITSYYFINKYCTITKKHDPKEVVLDEYAGQYIACFLAYFLLGWFGSEVVNLGEHYFINYYVLITSFAFFRFFDITKLSLVGYYDKQDNSFSVLMDDVVAGIFAGIFTTLIFVIV